MQFFTLAFSTLLALSQALTLEVESDNQEVNGQYLSSKHEGAAINYVFLGEGGQDFTYEASDKKLYFLGGEIDYQFGISGEIVQFGVAAANQTEFQDGYLSVVGQSGNFYACKNINDPYRYSESEYAVLYSSEAKADCIEIKIKEASSSSSSSAAPSSSAASSSSAAPSSSSVPTVAPVNGAASKSFGGAAGLAALAMLI